MPTARRGAFPITLTTHAGYETATLRPRGRTEICQISHGGPLRIFFTYPGDTAPWDPG